MSESTPMMRQYRGIKAKYPDAVLFFRLGDFYEMFEHDAKEVSSILNLTLTSRNGTPMCGIPYHASSSYIPRLLKKGKKIAICEQVNIPDKGIAQREVVEVITPGTVLEEEYLDQTKNNYLTALSKWNDTYSFVSIDLSTAEFRATSFPVTNGIEHIKKELARLSPSEILIQESLLEEDKLLHKILKEKSGIMTNPYPDWSFDLENSYSCLLRQFKTANLKGFGISEKDPAILSCGVLLDYIGSTSGTLLPHIVSISRYSDSEYVGLDESTQKNLELIQNMQEGDSNFTLFSILNRTKTSLGSRKLRFWILHPLQNRKTLESRLHHIDQLYQNQILLSSLRETLSSILDIERLSARIAMNKAHGKDLLSLKYSLKQVAAIDALSYQWRNICWSENELDTLLEIFNNLEHSIHEDPSILFTEGRLIKTGFNHELDKLRNIKQNSSNILHDYIEKEKKNSGIQSLKIKHNKIIGYYLEVTKSNLHLVPEHFIRRQSLVGGERYTTNKLMELEAELNSAEEKIVDLEKELFIKIRDSLKNNIPLFLSIASGIAWLDCIQSLAFTATLYGYTKPIFIKKNEIRIENGKHPVVEAHLPPGDFIPNSIITGDDSSTFSLITGPNMAGKSTFLRQVALIVLMAQIGSFVPAESVSLNIVDKIFCRVGASDNLARGESTFLVEMNETAFILREATDKSLIIMDEVGRGTGTGDGLAIAWAVSEYLIKIKAKTLFATHYHELTTIRESKIQKLFLDVQEKKGNIVFLKKVKKGAAGNSYGIHVARLAGLPEKVVQRALSVLLSFSEQQNCVNPPEEYDQPNLFTKEELIVDEIKSINVDNITPLEALNILARLKKEVQKKE